MSTKPDNLGQRDKPSAVYALDTDLLDVIDDTNFDPFDSEHKGVKIYRPPHINPRIPAQQGLFTVHFQPENLLQFVPDHLEVFDGMLFCNKRIPDKDCGYFTVGEYGRSASKAYPVVPGDRVLSALAGSALS